MADRGTIVLQSTSLEGNAVISVRGFVPLGQGSVQPPDPDADPFDGFYIKFIRTLPEPDDETEFNPAQDFSTSNPADFSVGGGLLSVIWDWCTGDPQPRVHTTEVLFARPLDHAQSFTGGVNTIRIPRPPLILYNGCQHDGISEVFDASSYRMVVQVITYPTPASQAEFDAYDRDNMPTGGTLVGEIDGNNPAAFVDLPFTGALGGIRMVNVPPSPPPGAPPGLLDAAYEVHAVFSPLFTFVPS